MENSKRPAFPNDKELPLSHPEWEGLTKREYFAAMAMQGILANAAQQDEFKVNDYGINSERIAELSIDCADRLLKQLEL